MTFVVTHRLGDMERDIPIEELGELLDELSADSEDQEHTEVAVADGSCWSLMVRVEARGTYRLALEDIEGAEAPPPVHMAEIDRDETLRIMGLVASGRVEDVTALKWSPGY